MTNEELILQKLERLERRVEPLLQTAETMTELKEDLIPLGNHAFNLMISQLQEVEAGFQLEDLIALAKRAMRSVRTLTWSLHQLENMVEFARDLEPLLKSAVPQAIGYLDDLEQRGVFRMIKAMMDVRAKVAAEYDADDIDQIGDGLVALLGLAKTFSEPKTVALLTRAAQLPASIDLDNCPKAGPFRLAAAGFNSEVKEGLGVVLALTKAMARLKQPSEQAATAP